MLQEISSFELSYLVTELQTLLDGKIDKVFMNNNKDMFLQLHKASLGKVILRISVPHYLYMSNSKPQFDSPSNFCMALRKRINNARIREISQIPHERIVKILLETKETEYSLYLEFFLKGNILLVDSNGKIDLLAQNQSWSDRMIRAKQQYVLPEKKIDSLSSTLSKPLVKFLAGNMNFGGEFAEEICFRAGVDKTKKKLTIMDLSKLKTAIKELQQESTKGYIYDDGSSKRIFPIEMKSLANNSVTTFETFSEALSDVFTTEMEDHKISKREAAFQEKIGKFQKIYDAQQEALEKNERIMQESSKKGDLIYSHFQELSDILSQLKKARETMSWKEIKAKLKGHPIVKMVNEKKGTMVVDLK